MRIIKVRFVSTPPEALSRPRGPRMKRLYRHGGRKMSLRCTLLVPTCKRCAASGFLARSNNGMHHAPQCMLAPSAVASVLRSNLHELKASGLLGFLLVCFLPIGQYAGTTLRSKQSPFCVRGARKSKRSSSTRFEGGSQKAGRSLSRTMPRAADLQAEQPALDILWNHAHGRHWIQRLTCTGENLGMQKSATHNGQKMRGCINSNVSAA